ncbi:hypothetical protein EJ02DRAFT_103651 [Clathrospora elynae]|uniref:Uncharacterized protein n=1 Tax=Clathrospora elynae TaxID=706981 RepID=A0A6A5T565_9PLEO|nr:hypothetical protein EJ02DRAFT_103651 [Clathrospora elynae]
MTHRSRKPSEILGKPGILSACSAFLLLSRNKPRRSFHCNSSHRCNATLKDGKLRKFGARGARQVEMRGPFSKLGSGPCPSYTEEEHCFSDWLGLQTCYQIGNNRREKTKGLQG